jgi:hypothetical protein
MAFAQHPEILSVATTSAPVPLNFQICTNPSALSASATNSSLKSLGATEFAEPPLVVVAVRKSWDSIAPVESREKALMYPVESEFRAREVAHKYLPE